MSLIVCRAERGSGMSVTPNGCPCSVPMSPCYSSTMVQVLHRPSDTSGGTAGLPVGTGDAEVHQAPRVIASWDGLDSGRQPASTGTGEYDLALGPLITALHAPAVSA